MNLSPFALYQHSLSPQKELTLYQRGSFPASLIVVVTIPFSRPHPNIQAPAIRTKRRGDVRASKIASHRQWLLIA